MIKLSASFSKKVPGEEQYSSLSYHASLERELSDGLSQEQIQQTMQSSYALLEQTVESEITRAKGSSIAPQGSSSHIPQTTAPAQAKPTYHGHNNPQAPQLASSKQVQFLNRLGAECGMSQDQINAMALQQFGVATTGMINKSQASKLIEQMQQRKGVA